MEIVRHANRAYFIFKVGTLKIYIYICFEHLISKILFEAKKWCLESFLLDKAFQRGDLKKLGWWVFCHPDTAKGSNTRVTHTSVHRIAAFSLVTSKRECNMKRVKNFFFVQFTFKQVVHNLCSISSFSLELCSPFQCLFETQYYLLPSSCRRQWGGMYYNLSASQGQCLEEHDVHSAVSFFGCP